MSTRALLRLKVSQDCVHGCRGLGEAGEWACAGHGDRDGDGARDRVDVERGRPDLKCVMASTGERYGGIDILSCLRDAMVIDMRLWRLIESIRLLADHCCLRACKYDAEKCIVLFEQKAVYGDFCHTLILCYLNFLIPCVFHTLTLLQRQYVAVKQKLRTRYATLMRHLQELLLTNAQASFHSMLLALR